MWGAISSIIVGLAALVAFVWSLKKNGQNEERIKDEEKTANAVKTANQENTNVTKLPDGAAADELRDKYSRD